jgi:hypothetical protein
MYPVLAAGVFALRDSIALLVFVQLIAGAATACLAAAFARRVGGSLAGLIAGLVVAVEVAAAAVAERR